MKSDEQWLMTFRGVCFNDPACSGQQLPGPQTIAFVRAIQADALLHAAEIAESERVEESRHAEDKAYNMAIKHVSEAILAEADKLKTI